jgi:type II secretory pathway pseudopilin PulG
VIIAVAAAVAIPAVNSGQRQREVRRTMQKFVSTVRHASSTSIFERRRVELRVWPENGEYGIVVPVSDRYDHDEELDVDERDELEEEDEVRERFLLPATAAFGEIEGGRSDDLDDLGTISFDFFPTGSSSGGAIEFVFGEDRGRQAYVLTINPLVTSLQIEEGS